MKEIEEKVGKDFLVNNIPTAKELSESDKSQRQKSDFEESKVV